jgi:hypothetical protein
VEPAGGETGLLDEPTPVVGVRLWTHRAAGLVNGDPPVGVVAGAEREGLLGLTGPESLEHAGHDDPLVKAGLGFRV